jgi:hypothetical protein
MADAVLGLVHPGHHGALAREPLGHRLADLARGSSSALGLKGAY